VSRGRQVCGFLFKGLFSCHFHPTTPILPGDLHWAGETQFERFDKDKANTEQFGVMK
jgi:hypothetical protein